MSVNLMEAHTQWSTRPQDQRFETLDALRESVHGRRLRSRSVDIDCARTVVSCGDDEVLTINGQVTPCEPSHWSFGQLSQLVKAPAGYLRTLPKPMVKDLLNYGLQTQRDTVKFMTVTNPEGGNNTLQAVTSTTYGRIWDADVVDAVQRIQERTNGRFYNPKAYGMTDGQWDTSVQKPSGLYASDRDCFIFMIDGGSLLDAGPRAQLNRGFIAWNSETGSKTMGLMTFLFNQCCGNHIIMGASEVNKVLIRHTQNGPYRFDSEAAPALMAYANSTPGAEMDTIKKAQEKLLIDKGQKITVETLLSRQEIKAGKFTRAELSSAIDFAKSEEGDCRTLWQVVQGLTAYARGFDYIDARVDLETRAGKLLNSLK